MFCPASHKPDSVPILYEQSELTKSSIRLGRMAILRKLRNKIGATIYLGLRLPSGSSGTPSPTFTNNMYMHNNIITGKSGAGYGLAHK